MYSRLVEYDRMAAEFAVIRLGGMEQYDEYPCAPGQTVSGPRLPRSPWCTGAITHNKPRGSHTAAGSSR